ncbi:ABC transporter ATP-binding protein [soil metagenome]
MPSGTGGVVGGRPQGGSDTRPVPPYTSVAEGATPAVELIEITKSFPGVVANDHITLTAMPGEVLCVLGENGAGKSTLMTILSGLYQPDSGEIRVDGRPVRIDSPRSGRDLGIGMVYQHLSLIPTLSVLENLMLGSNPGLVLDADAARARLVELSGMLGVTLDPDAISGSLALGQQQQIEIIKALWKGSRVLILDEPTTMLTPQGIKELQKVLLQLKANGLAIIFITHKLHEAIAIGDRVAVLKLGRVVGEIGHDVLTRETPQQLQRRIVSLMFGEQPDAAADIAELREEAAAEKQQRSITTTPVLEVIDAVATGGPGQHGIDGASLAVRGGEILGVGGVDGNGQQALAQAIAGQQRLEGGDIRLAGVSIARLGVSARQHMGLRYVTDDRLGEGVVAPYAVSLNIVLKRIGQPPFWRRGAIDRPRINAAARMLIEQFDIRTPHEETRIGALSGGNIQKTLLARELSFEPRVVVFNKPTHGLDVRTIATVRERIRQLAEAGVAIIVISTDLDELVDLADRVAVLFEGRIVGEVEVGQGAEARIGELILGAPAAA